METKKTGYPSIDRTHLQGIPEEKLHPKILPLSMLATFLEVNKDHLDEIAVEERKENRQSSHTKTELRDGSIAVARALLSFGLRKGDRIALVTDNCYEGILVMFGANAVGIQVAMFNPITCAEREVLKDEIDTFNPSIVFLTSNDDSWSESPIFSDDYPFLQHIVFIGATALSQERVCDFTNFIARNSEVSFEQTMAEVEACSLSKDDAPMLYLKTTGSVTGKPKTLPFSNRAIFASMIYASNSTGTKTRDATVSRALCQIPWQYGYGWMPLFVNLMGGNQVVLVNGSDADVAKYHELQPSYIYGTPITLRQFMDLTPEDADLSSLTAFFCAGASLSEKEYQVGMKFFQERGIHCEIRNNYGVSEGLCVGTASDGVPHRPGTSGKFYVGPEWLIVDKNMNEVKYGEIGEVIFASESLCQGYYNNPEATKKSFIQRDGKTFFRTGDYMSLSEDGYVTFIGRSHRFFVAQGILEKVNCETIEQGLDSLDIVSKSAVIVARDERGIEGAKAFVVLKKSFLESFDEEDQSTKPSIEAIIRGRLSGTLKYFQIPREIVIVDTIPLMNGGKINYPLLESM